MFWKSDMTFKKPVWDLKVCDEDIENIERHFGYKLPSSFVEIYKIQNGGKPAKRCHASTEPCVWADDFVEVDDFWPLIGKSNIIEKNKTYKNEWDFPDVGIYFAPDPTEGSGAFALDYSDCEEGEEPEVSYVFLDGCEYCKIYIASSFANFINELQRRQEFDK